MAAIRYNKEDRFAALNLTRSRNRSTVWQHFGFKMNELTICTCIHCECSLRYCNNTTNLRNHLKNKHPEEFFRTENEESQSILEVAELTENMEDIPEKQNSNETVDPEHEKRLYEKWKVLRSKYIRSKNNQEITWKNTSRSYYDFMDNIFGDGNNSDIVDYSECGDSPKVIKTETIEDDSYRFPECHLEEFAPTQPSYLVVPTLQSNRGHQSGTQTIQENRSATAMVSYSVTTPSPTLPISTTTPSTSLQAQPNPTNCIAVSSSSSPHEEKDEVYYFIMNLGLRLRKLERKQRLKVMNRMENILFEEEIME